MADMTRARLLAPLAALVLAAAGCGDDEDKDTGNAGTNSASTPAETTAEEPQATSGEAPRVDNAEDLSSKPQIDTPAGDPPTSLIKEDLVVGDGKEVKKGQLASMQYVGISWSTGEQFDASWDRGAQPFQFQVGQGMVIPGWDEGIPGMKVGGRRVLVIPPEMGYGPSGTPDGSIAPNETLVFVVDLVGVG
jgi:peptidylprolyl isomerase